MPPQKAVEPAPIQPAKIEKQQSGSETQQIDALAQSITRDGSWEIFRGERIHTKEVVKDQEIPGHTTLKVQTFKKDSTILKQAEDFDLFDNAEACIKYHQQVYKDIVNKDKIAEIKAKYNDNLKTFVPVIVDTDGNTYVGDKIANFLAKKY